MAQERTGTAGRIGQLIRVRLREAADAVARLEEACAADLARACEKILACLRRGGRVFVFGNGGSAAEAQHLAAELEGRFRMNRSPLPVLALTTNASSLTAIANDLGFEEVFARQVEAHARRGDVVIAISTSGRSVNVLRAVEVARRRGAFVIAWTGRDGGGLRDSADLVLRAPSDDVARIQECHGTFTHVLCEAVERALFGNE